jgi:hypothetical protein
MKRNYKNSTIVDFQGRTDNQVIANEKIGCFSLIIFIIIAVVLIIVQTLKS